MKIPNHTLYAEKIYNLTETTGAVHEFTFCFNIFGASNTDMVRIRVCVRICAYICLCVRVLLEVL